MRRQLRTLLRRSLDSLLQPLSFHEDGFKWNRRIGEFIDVIVVEWGTQDTQAEYSFTMSCGVVWAPAFRATWEKPVPPGPIDATQCTVQSRIGSLTGGPDLWWNSSDYADEEMAADARARIEVVVVPFLDGMHSLPAMASFLSVNERHLRYPPEVISLATLRKALGDVDGARRVLTATVNRAVSPRLQKSAWTDHLARLLRELE